MILKADEYFRGVDELKTKLDRIIQLLELKNILSKEDKAIQFDWNMPLIGPGSITCDRAGPVTIEDCRTCFGTGGCTYGK